MLEARGILWGEVTIKRALARLVKRRLVNNSRGRPRGYSLPEALPLLRHLTRPPGCDSLPGMIFGAFSGGAV
jgi:hypothetical protein